MKRSRKFVAVAAGLLMGAAVLVVAPSSVEADTSTMTCGGDDSVVQGSLAGTDVPSQTILNTLGGSSTDVSLTIGQKTTIVGTTVPPGDDQTIEFKTRTILDEELISTAEGVGVTSIDINHVKFVIAAGANVSGPNETLNVPDFTVNLADPGDLTQGPFSTTWNITGPVGDTATWNLATAELGAHLVVPALGNAEVDIGLSCTATKPAASALILPPDDERGPVVPDLTAQTDVDTPVDVDLAGAVEDGPAAATDPDTLEVVSDPSHGSVTFADGVATYTPDAGFAGDDQFAYQACTEPFVVIAALNEQQQVNVTGLLPPPTADLTRAGGQWTLAFGGETTAPIEGDATAANVQAALEALSTIGAGNVTVTGGPGGDGPFTVEFVGDLAGQDLEALVAESLQGPTVAVTIVQDGAPEEIGTVCNAGVVSVTVSAVAVPVTTTPVFTG